MEERAIYRAIYRARLPSVQISAVGIHAIQLNKLPPATDGSLVIVAGLAGGLDPQLKVGDVVLDASDNIPLPNLAMRGHIHTSVDVVASVADKSALFGQTHALAVDMEQAIVAAWAHGQNCQVIGLRAISDSAFDAIDPILLRLVDELGRPQPSVIAKALIHRPTRIVDLLRLARRSNLALANLSTAVVDLVRQLH